MNQALFAAEAGRSDETAIKAFYLIYFQGLIQEHPAQAIDDQAPRIRALLERLGGNDELEGKLHAELGFLALQANRYDDADRESRLAVEILERRFGPDDLQLTPALHTRISSALFHDDARTALALTERMLAIWYRPPAQLHRSPLISSVWAEPSQSACDPPFALAAVSCA